MKRAKEGDKKEILEFLNNKLADCLYMYIDIKKYGLTSANMDIWIERDNEKIHTVIMRYYDSLQMISDNNNWNKEWIKNLIIKEEFTTISGRADMIKELLPLLDRLYNVSFGTVFQLLEYRKADDSSMVTYAQKEDLEEIAKLICIDEVFKSSYQISSLEKQLKDRMDNGMGRNVIIKSDGKIISHIATYAELDDISITSGMITHPEYRDSSYSFLVESFLTNELLKEGKRVFTLVLDGKRVTYLRALKGKECGKYGRLTLNVSNN